MDLLCSSFNFSESLKLHSKMLGGKILVLFLRTHLSARHMYYKH